MPHGRTSVRLWKKRMYPSGGLPSGIWSMIENIKTHAGGPQISGSIIVSTKKKKTS